MSAHTHIAQVVLTAAPPGKSGLGGICPGANLEHIIIISYHM